MKGKALIYKFVNRGFYVVLGRDYVPTNPGLGISGVECSFTALRAANLLSSAVTFFFSDHGASLTVTEAFPALAIGELDLMAGMSAWAMAFFIVNHVVNFCFSGPMIL